MLLNLRLITPTSSEIHENLESITLPGETGEITVLPGHELMVVQTTVGLCTVCPRAGLPHYYFSQSGFARIGQDEVVLTSIEIIPSKQLSWSDLEQAKVSSATRLAEAVSESEKQALQSDMKILEAKLEIIKKLKNQN